MGQGCAWRCCSGSSDAVLLYCAPPSCTALERWAFTSGCQYTLQTSDPVVNPGDFPECSEVFWFLCAEDTALGKQTLKKYNL